MEITVEERGVSHSHQEKYFVVVVVNSDLVTTYVELCIVGVPLFSFTSMYTIVLGDSRQQDICGFLDSDCIN